MDIERRIYNGPIEIRAEDEDKPAAIIGYAAVFNSMSEDLGGFVERIQPGAFSEAVQRDDVRALFNHDSNYVLGRTTAGTLKLTEDEIGLRYEISPPKTQWATDLRESIRRGDVSQSSFGFTVHEDSWDGNTRTLKKVKLYDVSPVTFPAYHATSVSARALEHVKNAVDSDKTEHQRGRVEVLRKKLELTEIEQ